MIAVIPSHLKDVAEMNRLTNAYEPRRANIDVFFGFIMGGLSRPPGNSPLKVA